MTKKLPKCCLENLPEVLHRYIIYFYFLNEKQLKTQKSCLDLKLLALSFRSECNG